jgi:hypothetical protein
LLLILFLILFFILILLFFVEMSRVDALIPLSRYNR